VFDEEAALAREKALDREAKLHEKRLSGIYGDEAFAHFTMCPLCEDGFLTPRAPGQLPEEQLAAIDALAGKYAPPEYIEDADYEKCAHCAGHGHTLTGAVNPEHLTKLCDKCGGNGFVNKAAPQGSGVVYQWPAPETPPAAPEPVNYGAPGTPDNWGRPPGHPHYGIEPQYVTG
jgi:hypothetical protein